MKIKTQLLQSNVVQWFEHQVQKNPNILALVDNSILYNYENLNKKVNQLAHALLVRNLKINDRIAILLEPGADYIITILAIIKIGAVYIPLDAQAPEERIKTILHDAKPNLIIAKENKAISLLLNNTILLKQLYIESTSCSKSNPLITIPLNSPLYIIYTSGSTGTPKGIIIPHQAVMNLAAIDNYAKVKEQQRMAQFNNLAFDACIFEIWSALLNSATLCIIPENARKNHILLKESLEYLQINHILIPTGYFHQLIKSAITTLDTVEAIVFGGEAVNPLLLKIFVEHRKQLAISTQLINGYGPSEATVVACRKIIDINQVNDDEELASIGNQFTNVETYILDENMNPVDEGELCLSGLLLALGYHNAPAQNQEKFIKNPFCDKHPFQILYKTGDLVKKLPSGNLLFIGRIDDQVKVGGFRVHLNEIEHELVKHPNISMASVAVELGGSHHKILTAYIVFSDKNTSHNADEIRAFLAKKLPAYMLPAKYVLVDSLPLTRVGKVDKKALASIPHTDLSFHIDSSSESNIEEKIKNIWKHLLNRTAIDTHKNLFDLGANSLLLTEACTLINKELNADITITDMLTYPTIHKLALFMDGVIDEDSLSKKTVTDTVEIAIVGMSCRFPKSRSLDEYWDNLCQGIDCLNHMPPLEKEDEYYVPVRGTLDNIDLFDASFFGFNPSDASITDPQHRLFLECAWEALEHAGIAPEKMSERTISVFAGMTDSSYLHENLLKNSWFLKEHDSFAQRIATSMSMLSTQISYRLNLKGRSVNVNTACSTGLITVDHACQELLLGTSDIAIAGSSSITLPQEHGYIYQQGGILSPDGVCRPFSDKANGTVFSNGVGVVILKRLDDALADNDTVYAVIKARAVNNDGRDKLGFTAPSINGQKACIQDALIQAGISPDEVGLIEAHGTATALGDVIELNALSSTYTKFTDKKQFCALGSVKANIGHTDATAGIASLIKTALCLYHKKIPPLIHFQAPNPELGLHDTPFYVNTNLLDWENNEQIRYAGVSAFGIGGTNVHMILSEPPHKTEPSIKVTQEELILLSAKNESAFKDASQALSSHIEKHPEQAITDIAYTLQTGREDFACRGFAVGDKRESIIDELKKIPSFFYDEDLHYELVFLFSGQGTQYPGMAMGLLESIPLFKQYVTLGSKIAETYIHCSLLSILQEPKSPLLKETRYAQPALFIIEYALAKVLMDCGVQPEVLIGHSLGEYVAACIAGVFTFEDGLALVCERGMLMQQTSKGGMILLETTEEELYNYLKDFNLDLALHNTTHHYVVSGDKTNILALENHLNLLTKPYRKLPIQHAFHSQLMSSIEESFLELFSNITLNEPQIPIVSNLTGNWLTAEEAMSKEYWYRHMRETVRFCESIQLILHDKHPLFIEIGPGQGLCQFVTEISQNKKHCVFTLPNHQKKTSDTYQILHAIGTLWTRGVSIQVDKINPSTNKKRLALPTYPFQKQRYWIENNKGQQISSLDNKPCFYKNAWSYYPLENSDPSNLSAFDFIIFKDKQNVSQELVNVLHSYHIDLIIVEASNYYQEITPSHYHIDPENAEHYQRLFLSLKSKIQHPVIYHCFSLDKTDSQEISQTSIDEHLNYSFYSVLYLTQALVKQFDSTCLIHLSVITTETQYVTGIESLSPVNASLTGAVRTISLEHKNICCELLDCSRSFLSQSIALDIIYSSIQPNKEHFNPIKAYRNELKWMPEYIPSHLTQKTKKLLKNNGIYLLTGGLGGIALSLCFKIMTEIKSPTFILCSRTSLPEEVQWEKLAQDESYIHKDKIKQLIELKKQGATLVIYSVNIGQINEVRQLSLFCALKFGQINGIIHAAGIPGGGIIQLKNKEKAHSVLLPKIYGAYFLAQAFHQNTLDFVLLMSSIASITGEPGQIDYCAANSSLDAFVHTSLFNTSNILCINWNTWEKIGMSINANSQNSLDLFSRGNSISPQQGQELFITALSYRNMQYIVSNYPPTEYLNLIKNTKNKSHNKKISRELFMVSNNFIEPQGEIEQKLALLWQENLHINQMSRTDNYFSLGGHSLKALSLIEKINKAIPCNLSIQHLYQSPTIERFATLINSQSKKEEEQILVPLKIHKDTNKNFFFCHPASGMIYCFNELTTNLKIDNISFYGLQDPSINAGILQFKSIKEMAHKYTEAIKKIQKQGPYYLIGYSFGGTVMHEVAYNLIHDNESVNLLMMIDSWCVFSNAQLSKENFIKNYLSKELESHKTLTDMAWERMNLLFQHQPSIIKQKMILLKANELNEDYQDVNASLNGWDQYNHGFIELKTIQANHDNILKNGQQIIQQILADYKDI
ncbi:MAG: non-ribosomal peptide synthetase/polyketide synthase [Legionella sp.]|nr:non-ribosomal peptide synthetase/polyketide synthase [Chitinophaga sp.]PJD96061.1 MAG: non-ribosomal peptide synthetase/polyketide synthase [Legionella sp.]